MVDELCDDAFGRSLGVGVGQFGAQKFFSPVRHLAHAVRADDVSTVNEFFDLFLRKVAAVAACNQREIRHFDRERFRDRTIAMARRTVTRCAEAPV